MKSEKYKMKSVWLTFHLSFFICHFSFSPTSVSANDKELVAWWRFDDGQGRTATDSSGNGHHGTLRSMTGNEWGAGKVGGALLIAGDDDCVLVKHSKDFDFAKPFSFSFWTKFERLPFWGRIVGKGRKGFSLMVPNNESRLAIVSDDPAEFSPLASIRANAWQHIAVVNDGQMLLIYVNGMVVHKATSSVRPTPNTEALTIGNAEHMNRPMRGWIDELRIYRRALSMDEVKTQARVPDEPIQTRPVGRALLPILAGATGKSARPTATWTKPLAAFASQNCSDCHSGDSAEGGFTLKQLHRDLTRPSNLDRWSRVFDRVARGEMPPKSETQPSDKSRREFLENLASSLISADRANRKTALRRLNRVEYEYTVCDLLGIRADVASLKAMLPTDASANGFDNNADALAISTEQMEAYMQAADRALNKFFNVPRPQPVHAKMKLGDDPYVKGQVGKLFKKTPDGIALFQSHWSPTRFSSGRTTTEGTYRVRIKARTYQTDKRQTLAVYGGNVVTQHGRLVGYYEVWPGAKWNEIELTDYSEAGGHYRIEPHGLSAGNGQFGGPGIEIGEMEVVGPLEKYPPPRRVELLNNVDFRKANVDQSREILARFLSRAFRRSVDAAEVELYLEFVKQRVAAGQQDGLWTAMKAVLCSPEFLFLEERNGRLSLRESVSGVQRTFAERKTTIDDYSLASRLSYFLWNSMPDDELFKLAAKGTLAEPATLRQQVERMLDDPKSQRFVDNFTGQWLNLRDIDFTQPNGAQYPEFDRLLRFSLPQETQLFFREILDNDHSLLEFVDSDWLVINQRLAEHYGIAGVEGQKFRRVKLLPTSVRGGVITQASVLKVTANGTNTSPVVRGNWVLKNIVGREVPPPPQNVSLIEPDIRGATTIREQLAKHRDIQACAVCHNKIDPPGFALESFNPIGGWRDWYRSLGAGHPLLFRKFKYVQGPIVDPSGEMEGGRQFADVREFKKLLLQDKEQIARCLTEKLMTYALGRSLGFSDRPAVEKIVMNLSEKQFGFRTLVHEVVQSSAFHVR